MKGKKYIVPLLLAGVTATGVVSQVQQSVNVSAATDTSAVSMTGVSLKVEGGFQDKYILGENDNKIYLPKVTVSGSGSYKYTVTKSNLDVEVKSDASGEYFEPVYDQGYYNISLVATEENVVVSEVQNFSIWVEKADGVINLPTNSKYVIPAKIPASQTGFKIPAPTVTKGDDEEATRAGLMGSELRVRLVSPKNESTSLTLTSDTINETEGIYDEYYNVAADKIATPGTYTIVYEYVTGEAVVTRLESNFQVVAKGDFVDDINLTIKYGDVTAKATVGTDVKVPKVTVTDTSNASSSVNAYVEVKIVNTTTGKTVTNFNYDDYTFHPTELGTYTITYKASIPLFNKSTTEVTPRQMINVVDNQSASVMATYSYDVDDNGAITKVYTDDGEKTEDLEDYLVSRKAYVPSVAVLGDNGEVKVTIPAAYASDNLDSYKDLKGTIKRYLKYSNGTMEEISGDVTKPVEVTLKSKGKYQFVYKASDLADNADGRAEYDIQVYDKKDIEDGEAEIDFTINTKSISDRERTFTFKAPTAIDTYDTEVDVKTFYQVQLSEGIVDAVELTETNGDGEYELDIQDIISKHTSTTIKVTGLKIYAKAYLDATLEGTRDAFATVTKENGSIVVTSTEYNVAIVDSSSDKTAATFGIYHKDEESTSTWNTELVALNADKLVDKKGYETDGIDDNGYALDGATNVVNGLNNKVAAFDQDSTIVLPEVRFVDTDNNLNITIVVTNENGDVVDKKVPESVVYDSAKNTYTVSGAEIVLTSGIHTVTYQAKDTAGNFYVQAFGIRANDTTPASIYVVDEAKFDSTIEVGKKFVVPTAKLEKNHSSVGGEISWEVVGTSAGAKFIRVGDEGFVPMTAGEFTIRYFGTDDQEIEANSKIFEVSAEDTTKPVINLDTTYYMPKNIDFTPETDKTYMRVSIPLAYAHDGRFEDQIDYGYGKSLDVSYTVTGPDGVTRKTYDYTTTEIAGDSTLAHVKYFEANDEGKYTIKYETMDVAGNKASLSYTIAIGDCIDPTIDWKEDSDIPTKTITLEELKKNDNIYTLDLSGLIVDDEDATEEDLKYIRDNLKAELTNSSGTKLTNIGDEYNQWEITEAGTYTLKITIKDKAGNDVTTPYTITVPSEEAEEEKISPVVGTILVVLSVVVLAGVVIYFVVSSKKKGAKAPKKSKKNN